MRSFLRYFLIALVLLPMGFSFAEERPFVHPDVIRDAERYEALLKSTTKAGGKSAAQWRKLADGVTKTNDLRQARDYLAAAVIAEPGNAHSWLALADTLLRIAPNDYDERFQLMESASGAAYTAYLRSKDDRLKARALVTLAEALKAREYWRPAIDAYKASLALDDVGSVRAAYDVLRSERGFRIIDYSVDSDAPSPRLCILFSEDLAAGQLDYAKYFSLAGAEPLAVTREDRQICLDGLKHGERYLVQVRAGLPSAVGEDLAKTSELSVYVRDRSPQAHFAGRSYVLPSVGQQGIPIVTVNTEAVAVEIYRIGDRALARSVLDGDLANQLSGGQFEDLRNRLGTAIWTGSLPVKQRLNEEVSTAFPVSEALTKLLPGVYVMSAVADGSRFESWDQRATQWFIVSDLGLTALSGSDGVHAFVRSLERAEAAQKVGVKLVARNNDVLATGETDASGHVHFEAGLARGEGGAAPALLIAETAAGDFAFLDLVTNAFDLTDRGVAGRASPGPLDAYVVTERGVYRPGEDVHFTALLRDQNAQAVAGLPLTLKIVRPDGVEHRLLVLQDEADGGRAAPLPLPTSAMTGTWRVLAHADPSGPVIGDTSFLVADYVPERLELLLAPAAGLEPGKTGSVKIEGRYLYGPPAANLAVEGEVTVSASSKGLIGFEDYRFGLHDEAVMPVRSELTSLPRTDAAGIAQIPIELMPLPRTSRLLEARVVLRLREPSGRTIERAVTMPVTPKGNVIGLKPASKGVIERGGIAEFDVVMLAPDGQAQSAAGLKWQVDKIDYQYQWYGRNGSWSYEPVTFTSKVLDGTVDIPAGAPARVSVPVQWGEYQITVTANDGAASSTTFSAGWYGGEKADSPEVLRIGFDHDSYKVGDTAKLSIIPDGPGKAVVAILRDGLISSMEIDVPAEGASIDLPVTETMAPGAYVTATLYRPMDVVGKRMPTRSIGVKWLTIDSSARTVGVTLDLPGKVASGTTIDVPVRLTGVADGEAAHVVVAAVDVGILNLTNYASPAPEAWYYGQRQLGTEFRDLYGRMIDGMRAEKGAARTGGDGGGFAPAANLPSVMPVSLYSGIIRAGADGTAHASFELPEFNGTLRFMAMAWTKTKLGHADKEMIVRDPVAMLVSGPRFLTLGDDSRLVFDLHNVEGAAGSYTLAVSQTDETGAAMPASSQTVELGTDERKLQVVPLKADRIGQFSYAVQLTGPGDIAVARSFGLTVRPPAGDIRRSTVQTLAAKGGKITVTADVLKDLIPDSAKVTVSVGPAASFDVAGLLTQLDRYPYGCAEQTTSRALPLLYLNQVATASGILPDGAARERVQKAVDRLFEMQDYSGAFGLWGPGNSDLWLSAYVTDFLTRAKEQGYKMPARAFDGALDRLQNSLSFAADFERGGEEIAYALYVLARNARAPIGDLRYYVDTRLGRFASPLAKAQLGAALAMYGDKTRAETAFDSALADYETTPAEADRRDYGTNLRDGAATLTLISETGMRKERVSWLVESVGKSRLSKLYTSTQEQAWLLLAARSLIEQGRTLALDVNGTPQVGSLMSTLSAGDLAASPYAVTNQSDQEVMAVVTVNGDSLTAEPASAKGFVIERSYYALDGSKVSLDDPTSVTVAQNDRLVVVLKLATTDGMAGRVLVVDRLPAGLEIENPALVESGSIASLPWLQGMTWPQHTEFRDDRFVAALDLGAAQPAPAGGAGDGDGEEDQADTTTQPAIPGNALTMAYVVRAVTPGSYVRPAATVEDMYRPERFARTAAGRLEVNAQQ